MINQIEYGKAVVDTDTIIFADRAFCQILKVSEREISGRQLSSFFQTDDGLASFRTCLRDSTGVSEKAIVTSWLKNDGTTAEILIKILPSPENEREGWTVEAFDLTRGQEPIPKYIGHKSTLASIMEYSPVGIGIIEQDSTGNLVLGWSNPTMSRIFGYSLDEISGKSFRLFYRDDETYIKSGLKLNSNIEKHGISSLIQPMIRKDGSDVHVKVQMIPVQLDTKRRLLTIIEDVSRQALNEKEINTQEERYRELFNGMINPVQVFETRDGGRSFIYSDLNDEARRERKRLKDNPVGKSMIDVFPNVGEAGILNLIRCVYRTGEPIFNSEILYEEKGKKDWYKMNAFRLSSREVALITNNITERKLAQDALVKSELLYRKLIEISPFGIQIIDTNGKITFTNKAFQKIHRRKGRELREKYVWDLIAHEKNRKAVKKFYRDEINHQPEPFPYFSRHRSKNGNIVELHINWDYLYSVDGGLDGIISTATDITNIKRLKSMLQDVINSIGHPLYIASKEFKIEFQSELCLERYGNLFGKTCYRHLFNQDKPCEFCRMIEGLEENAVKTRETNVIGEKIYEFLFSPFIQDKKDMKSIVVFRDITRKKNLQAEAIRSAHLASIGELAAGVAHEINNPVTGIISISEILTDKFDQLGGDRKIPERITIEAERISKIVRNLLSFARVKSKEYSEVDIRDVIIKSIELTEKQMFKDGIHLRMELSSNLPLILGNDHELQQVFLNLISNARYALNEKYPHFNDNKILKISARQIKGKTKSKVQVVFLDTGVGISKNLINAITDPFKSTKPHGVGTGLGLSISHGIIANHGGKLFFESRVGEFTKAMIDLPK